VTVLLAKTDPIPSWRRPPAVTVAAQPPPGAAVGVPGEALPAAGFRAEPGQALFLGGTPTALYGIGDPAAVTTAALRDAAAAFARAVPGSARLALELPDGIGIAPVKVAQAMVEGVLLARYAYGPLKADPSTPLESLALVTDAAEAAEGVRRGLAYARAGMLARDLANAPPSILTATRFAEIATELGAQTGVAVEVFDEKALLDMGCGGLLGVNAGSAEPPRMVKLRYEPAGADGRLTLVGKGIMYDSGGISLKPADAVHATMKNDMSGAGAILAAMASLRELGCTTAVTGYLMCTDNMPSGTATKLGDVLSIRGGKTVEVTNADAEGRLVMADALVLATEEPCDAIVDIATLTGACMRALGTQIAGVMGNDQPMIDRVLTAAEAVDEPAWPLPLAHRYRKELDSDVADMKNVGGPNAMAIHAALFLEEFVAGKPWAHVDMAGTAQNERASGWLSAGCTGYGARLLLDLTLNFGTPAGTAS